MSQLADGRYWFPLGTQRHHGRLEVGMLVAQEFAIWRIIRVDIQEQWDWDEEDGKYLAAFRPEQRAQKAPYRVWARPVADTSDALPSKRRGDRCVKVSPRQMQSWDIYPDDHYPVCVCCSGPVPCRWTEARKVAEQAIGDMARYETPGVCPACTEPVTKRQKSMTWTENAELIGGPPVTFHMRGQCQNAAMRYEKRWVAEAPDQRRARLSCSGRVITHGDGTYECTEITECPGPQAGHPGYTVCSCTDTACCAAKRRSCHPSPNFSQRLPDGSIRVPTGGLL